MEENGQVYADLAALVPEADVKRLEDAERQEMIGSGLVDKDDREAIMRYMEAKERIAQEEKDEKLLLDRASMREAIAAQREERGLPPVRGAEEEMVPEA